MKKLYTYSGPVQMFEKCIAQKWEGQTYAESPSKAKSNLLFQFKKQNGLACGAKVTLAGSIVSA